jgi:PKD domain
VNFFARLLNSPVASRFSAARGLALTLGLTAISLASVATPAQALVETVGPVTAGVQPPIGAYAEALQPKTYANASGNPVLHKTSTFAIYWDPTDNYWSAWQNIIDGYLQHAGTASGALESVFAVDSQYTDKSNIPASYAQTFKGGYTDTHAYPASGCTDPAPFTAGDQIGLEFGGAPTAVCLTSVQLESQLASFISAHGLPKGMGSVYYLLTPPGVTVCLDAGTAAGHCSDSSTKLSYEHSFCSYHADINPGGSASGDANTILYAAIPWTAGGAGDNFLEEADERRPGWECQDGGINPAGKHGYELEKVKEKNAAQEKAFAEMDAEEKREAEEAEELEGPHAQEPNQVPCPTTNGSCAYGLADLIVNQMSLEQQNIVTDPLLNSWQDANKYENTDECRFEFALVLGGSVTANTESRAGTLYNQTLAGGNYYLNNAFNLSAYRLPQPGDPCINHVNLDPKFTAPNPVNAGEIVGFDGMESDIALDAAFGYSAGGAPQANYATYTWNFGDGSPIVSGYAPGAPTCETPWLSPCAASEFHSYQYGGEYEVTLTVKDVGGNTSSVTHVVSVVGPPPPGSGSGGGGSNGGSTSGSSTTTAGGSSSSSGGGSPLAAPIAAASIISKSLRTLQKGLAVRYSVNEQVAGRFEVLLSRSVASKLKIGGSPAVGLPTGSAPQIVIAKAVLVTTKGGRSTVRILLSKKVAANLAKAHKVALMLRLTVRNAAAKSPLTTTVISSSTLTR